MHILQHACITKQSWYKKLRSTPLNTSDRNLRRIDERYFGSRLANSLKTRRGRRIAFMFSVLSLAAFGYLAGFVVWLFIAPNPATPVEKFLSAAFWVALVIVTQLQPLMLLSARSAISWPGQPFDERQQQLNTHAKSDSLPYIVTLMGLAILCSMSMLIAVATGYFPFSHPMYGGIPLLLGVCVMLLAMAKNVPYLLLAWQLPDEPGDSGDFADD